MSAGPMMSSVSANPLDFERCYRAGESRDARFDGWFITAVKTTGIYCRPSCPTPIRPKRENVRFFPTAAAAQLAGFRACKRCRPDASPGSPEWNVRGDLVGRALRLSAEGIVDRDGVAGLAHRLSVSERHLHRLLLNELGAGPLAIARAQRGQTARTLIETTDLPFTDVAFAAGFESVRQFNDTVRDGFALTPPALRTAGRAAVVTLEPVNGYIQCTLKLESMSDLTSAVRQCRRLLDLDADPLSVVEVLSRDRRLSKAVRKRPGLRAPGAVDGTELAIQAVFGQQVSLAAARTLASRLVTAYGDVIKIADPTLTHLFPRADAIADADLSKLGVPAMRRATLYTLARALAGGTLALDAGADRGETYQQLVRPPGVGEWTAGYIVMRALGDPDTFLPSDLGIKKAGARLGLGSNPRAMSEHAAAWRPWRTYATHQLWATLNDTHKEAS